MKKFIVFFTLLSSYALYSQTYKFGYTSSSVTDEVINNTYALWQKKFVRNCSNNQAFVVKDDSSTVVSEGVAYGMLISAYMNDSVLYRKFYTYYKARINERGMMNWIYNTCETGDNKKNGATDAEMDIALSLLVAYKQWGTIEYKNWAITLLKYLQEYNYTTCNSVIVQKPGDTFGGCTCTNPSYYSPGYYRTYAAFLKECKLKTQANFWNKAADDTYKVLLANANPYTGLVYAWTNAEGKDPSDCYYEVSGSGTYNSYQYDACRTPWRISIDYLWWGNSQAKLWLDTIVNFIESPIYKHATKNPNEFWYGAGGIQNVVDSYWHNGLRRIEPEKAGYGHRHTSPFVGGFAMAGLCKSQQIANEYVNELLSISPERYYEINLHLIYILVASGKFYNPYQ